MKLLIFLLSINFLSLSCKANPATKSTYPAESIYSITEHLEASYGIKPESRKLGSHFLFAWERVVYSYEGIASLRTEKAYSSIIASVEKYVYELLIKWRYVDTNEIEVNLKYKDREIKFLSPDPTELEKFPVAVLLLLQKIADAGIFADYSKTELSYRATEGLMGELDPHSSFVRPQRKKALQEMRAGVYAGIGAVLNQVEEYPEIASLMEKGNAIKHLKEGDRLTSIDGKEIKNWKLRKIIDHVRGPAGTKVTLGVKRAAKNLKVSIERKSLRTDFQKAFFIGDTNYGFIRIGEFNGKTYQSFKDDIKSLKAKKEIKGLVIDLRANPGGFAGEAVKIIDHFLEEGGVLAYVERRRKKLFKASKGADLKTPLVILINGSSASASEIVAGTLKYNGRAVVVGDYSYGKGSVQMIFDSSSGYVPSYGPNQSLVKVTMAHWLAAGEYSIHRTGLAPDLRISKMLLDEGKARLTEKAKKEVKKEEKLTVLSYRKEDKPKDILKHIHIKGDNKISEDVAVKILNKLNALNKHSLSEAELKSSILEIKKRERKQLSKKLKSLGFKWQEEKVLEEGTDLSFDLSYRFEKGHSGILLADEEIGLLVKIKNKSKKVAKNLFLKIESKDEILKDKELLIGSLSPGEVREVKASIKAYKYSLSRSAKGQIVIFSGDQMRYKTSYPITLEVKEALNKGLLVKRTIRLKTSEKKSANLELEYLLENISKKNLEKIAVSLSDGINGLYENVESGRCYFKELAPGSRKKCILKVSFTDLFFEENVVDLNVAIGQSDYLIRDYDKFKLSHDATPTMEAATVVHPMTGEVLAFSGGFKYETNKKNLTLKVSTENVKSYAVYVNDKKVTYEKVRKDEKEVYLKLSNLKDGRNRVEFVYRDSNGVEAEKYFSIRRNSK